MKRCAAKSTTVTVQQIQVVATVVGGRSKHLFKEGGFTACLSMIVPGSCAQVFCLLSHQRDLNSASVNDQADVREPGRKQEAVHMFRRKRVPKCSHKLTY